MDQIQEYQKEETIDIKALLFKLRRHWYYFVFFVLVALAIAFIFNRYAEKVFQTSCTVLVKDEKATGADLISGMNMFAPQKKIQNEIGILQSYKLSKQAVMAMNLQVTYLAEGRFRFIEMYKSSPFVVEYDSAFPQMVNVPVMLKIINDDKYQIEFGDVERARLYNFREGKVVDAVSLPGTVKKTLMFGELYQTKFFSFRINRSQFYSSSYKGQRFKFYLNTLDQLAAQMRGVEISPINKEASILSISYKNQDAGKAIDYVNTLAEVYIQRDLDEKNLKASNTIKFIDSQLTEITDSLGNAEKNLQDFRAQNKIMDVSAEASTVFSKVNDLEKERTIAKLKAKY